MVNRRLCWTAWEKVKERSGEGDSYGVLTALPRPAGGHFRSEYLPEDEQLIAQDQNASHPASFLSLRPYIPVA